MDAVRKIKKIKKRLTTKNERRMKWVKMKSEL